MGTALFTGLSGLQAHQQSLDVIANNIANVNTTGYRSSSVQFEDVFYQTLQGASGASGTNGGTNAIQVGLGVKTGSISTDFNNGSYNTTGTSTDLAIEGNGFFVLSDGGSLTYTRDGSFEVNSQGYLIEPSTGQYVQGYLADENGVIDTASGITNIKIPVGGAAIVEATSNVDFTGNLDSDADVGTVVERTVQVYDSLGTEREVTLMLVKAPETNEWTWKAASGDQADFVGNLDADAAVGDTVERSVEVTDSEGTTRSVILTFTKTAADTWSYATSSADSTSSITGSGTVTFDSTSPSNGRISGTTTGTVDITFTDGSTLNMDMDFSLMTQVASDTNLTAYDPPAVSDTDISSIVAGGTLRFGTDGQILSGGTGNVSVDFVDTSASVPTDPLLFTFDFGDLTQLSGTSDADVFSQNGYPRGVLESYDFASDGTINAVYSNGLTRVVGQVATATFSNNGGLVRTGDNQFAETSASGLAQIGLPSTGGRGSIAGGTLESSNVDLATEFSNLILTQRGYQANARTITTADTLLQEAVNLVR